MSIEIRSVDSSAAVEWDAFVGGSPQASHYHQYEWRNFFSEYHGKQSFYLAAYQSDTIVGVLPLVRQKSWLFCDYLVSLPFLNYGGILANDDAVTSQLMDEAIDRASKLGVSHIELREFEKISGLPCRTDKVSMQLDLPPTAENLGQTLGAKRRSQIRRSVRENPIVLTGRQELVDRFYQVFSRNMRDLGTPVYSKTMFTDILNRFPNDTTIILIEIGGQPVASAFLLRYRDKTEIPWASTDRRFNKISVNMLLYWEVLKFSILQGSKAFDFGRSSIDSGTYRFKKQWGAKPIQLYWHYWIRENGRMPNLTPLNSKYAFAINMWKKLPLSVSKLLGPHIVRNLP